MLGSSSSVTIEISGDASKIVVAVDINCVLGASLGARYGVMYRSYLPSVESTANHDSKELIIYICVVGDRV